jgi:ribonucleoside-diphosphate reductase alpha chain
MSDDEVVVKRDGRREPVNMQKIIGRLQKLKHDVEVFMKPFWGENQTQLAINVTKIGRSTIAQMYNGITTSELDNFASDVSAYIMDDPDYSHFAGCLLVTNLEKNNSRFLPFDSYIEKAYNYIDEETGRRCPLISEELYNIGKKHAHQIDRRMDMNRNFLFDYFAMQTLIKGQYLLSSYCVVQKNGVQFKEMTPFETPQHMWMRVALGINGYDLQSAFELYDVMSRKFATHATPTLFNSGTALPQMSSCFLLDMKSDSISGIYDTLHQCALISKFAGGIGLSVNKVRASGSYITSTHGVSNGLVPMLKVFNSTARYCDQGGGKRKGSFAIYVSPYHSDIFDFLDLKKNTGAEESRSRDLFYALWISDLFMQRVIQDFERSDVDPPVLWSLFDPNTVLGLDEVYGEDFDRLYAEAEKEKKYTKQVPIRDLWYKIMEAQIESGTPYMLFKDSINRKSNQKNIGVIHSSNLCAEITEHTNQDEVSVCNLAGVSLPAYVKDNQFDYDLLYDVCRIMIRNLDKVIDRNFYPIEEAKTSNAKHRPVGLGIQGLADTFCKLGLPFDSPEAIVINRKIAETMYFASVTESHALAVEKGAYTTIDINGGAPIKKGIFQQDMWDNVHPPDPQLNWDWEDLRAKVQKDGVRNSLLIALMPTASSSQILGNTESFEPYYANIFSRKTKAGEFFCYNRHMIKHLKKLGLWKVETDPLTQKDHIPIMDEIIKNGGSIQKIDRIPQEVRNLYRCLLDIPLKSLTMMARDRSVYVDQSSSLNVHHRNKDNMMIPMTKYLCYAWKIGLKTGSYYTRTVQDLSAIDFAGQSECKLKSLQDGQCNSCSV